MNNFTHDLIIPFEIPKGGQLVDACSITVEAPTNKIIGYLAVIEQEVKKSELETMALFKNVIGDVAFEKMRIEAEGKKESVQSENNIVDSIITGGDINKCYIALCEILRQSATIDGVKMTQPLWEKMNPVDTKLILGAYIQNFIVTSLLT